MNSKVAIVGARGYFISFIHIIPDLIPILGYCDDVSIIIGSLVLMASQITEEIKENAKNSTKKVFPNINESEFKIINILKINNAVIHD